MINSNEFYLQNMFKWGITFDGVDIKKQRVVNTRISPHNMDKYKSAKTEDTVRNQLTTKDSVHGPEVAQSLNQWVGCEDALLWFHAQLRVLKEQ